MITLVFSKIMYNLEIGLDVKVLKFCRQGCSYITTRIRVVKKQDIIYSKTVVYLR